MGKSKLEPVLSINIHNKSFELRTLGNAYAALPEGKHDLYAITSSQRVVSVDFLEKLEALTILAGYKGAHKELGSIIKNKDET